MQQNNCNIKQTNEKDDFFSLTFPKDSNSFSFSCISFSSYDDKVSMIDFASFLNAFPMIPWKLIIFYSLTKNFMLIFSIYGIMQLINQTVSLNILTLLGTISTKFIVRGFSSFFSAHNFTPKNEIMILI